jgi:hypothetical protein
LLLLWSLIFTKDSDEPFTVVHVNNVVQIALIILLDLFHFDIFTVKVFGKDQLLCVHVVLFDAVVGFIVFGHSDGSG